MEAGKLLLEAAKESAEQMAPPLRTKKLYVMAALEIAAFKERSLRAEVGQGTATSRATRLATRAGQTLQGATRGAGNATQQTLAGLMKMDGAELAMREVGSAWDGALAYHFWLMAHRALYEANFEAAMLAAAVAQRVEGLLGTREVNSVLALSAFYAGYLRQCSRAFTRLQLLEGGRGKEAEALTELAFAVFSRQKPEDPSDGFDVDALREADVRSAVCIASAEPLDGRPTVRCRTCGHSMLSEYAMGHVACPLCHSRTDVPT